MLAYNLDVVVLYKHKPREKNRNTNRFYLNTSLDMSITIATWLGFTQLSLEQEITIKYWTSKTMMFFMELDENTGSGLNNFGKVMFLQVEANEFHSIQGNAF